MTPDDIKTKPQVPTHGWLTSDGMEFPVWVTASRSAYGRVDLKITPVAGGAGSVWVHASRVIIPKGKEVMGDMQFAEWVAQHAIAAAGVPASQRGEA